jgi:hypothetical protein
MRLSFIIFHRRILQILQIPFQAPAGIQHLSSLSNFFLIYSFLSELIHTCAQRLLFASSTTFQSDVVLPPPTHSQKNANRRPISHRAGCCTIAADGLTGPSNSRGGPGCIWGRETVGTRHPSNLIFQITSSTRLFSHESIPPFPESCIIDWSISNAI